MKVKLSLCLATVLATSTTYTGAAPLSTDTIKAGGSAIHITSLFHAGVQIEYKALVVDVDPLSASKLSRKADVVLITHTHPDHLDLSAIKTVSYAHRPGQLNTAIVAPFAAKATLASLPHARVLYESNGTTQSVATSHGTVSILAVPAYNLVRGPKPGHFFHPKGQFNGYVLTIGGKRLYFAGDTEAVPEMRNLKNITAAFLPMNLPFTMTPQEAARAARMIRPRLAYPYHYRYPFDKPNTNPEQFAAALKGSGIQVRFLEFYPASAVKKAMAAMASKK